MEKPGLARCGRCGVVFSYAKSNRDVLYQCHDCNTPNLLPAEVDATLASASAPSFFSSASRQSRARVKIMPANDDDDSKLEANIQKSLKSTKAGEVRTDTTADEDIRLAIELSMMSLMNDRAAFSDMDAKLKAVIEASLKEADNDRIRRESQEQAEDDMLRMAIAASLAAAEVKMTARSSKAEALGPDGTSGLVRNEVNVQLGKMILVPASEINWDDLEVDSVVYTARTGDVRHTVRMLREKSTASSTN